MAGMNREQTSELCDFVDGPVNMLPHKRGRPLERGWIRRGVNLGASTNRSEQVLAAYGKPRRILRWELR
jgi:hypothetical protein